MERFLEGLGRLAMAIMNYLAVILIWVTGIGAGIGLATMVSIAAGWTEARHLTLFTLAAWCPYVSPQGSGLEQFVWLVCLLGGVVAAQFLTAWIFIPREYLPEPTKAEREINNAVFQFPWLIFMAILSIIGRSIINVGRKILRLR